MKTVIYIDALIVLNLYVTYLTLRGTAVLLREGTKPLRMLFGAVLGGLASLAILLPDLPPPLMLLSKVGVGVVISFAAFGFERLSRFLWKTAVFLGINLLFAGGCLLLWSLAAPSGMVCGNGVVYFDISFFVIVAATAGAFLALKAVRYLIDTRTVEKRGTLRLKKSGKSAEIEAVSDTGNALCDRFSGLPAVVCPYGAVCGILPEGFPKNAEEYMNSPERFSGVRLIPYSTVSGSGLMPAFIPDEAAIETDRGSKSVSVIIGVSESTDRAVYNPKILI